MALMRSKPLLLRLLLKNNKNINVLLGPVIQCSIPAVNYSQNESEPGQDKLNKAMEAYLEKSKKYDKFLKEQLEEYELGKQFLAGMMGNKREMSQSEVDEAIEFLFPSGLFNRHARPKFKSPQELFERRKAAEFDFSGRPFHFLYYTTKPNYSQMLHEAGKKLQELQLYEQKLNKAGAVKPEIQLSLAGEVWLTNSELERKFLEKIHPVEYDKFLKVLTRLAEHPFSYMAKDFIKSFRKRVDLKKLKQIPVVLTDKEGIMHVTSFGSRKGARCTVKVSYPGSGKIEINDTGLNYFLSSLAREQVSR